MSIFRALFLLMLATFCAACSSKFKTYNGPPVTHVIVEKEARKLHLLSGPKVLKSYAVDLGFAPKGHKAFEGDGRTPEGRYTIDRRNPNSDFHLSIGIDYPNAKDIAFAEAAGKSPGGDIFIHGQPVRYRPNGPDWTAGCIAVSNRQIEQIYAMVKDGTPVTIRK